MKRSNVFSALNEMWMERVQSDSLRHLETSDAKRFLDEEDFKAISKMLCWNSRPRVTVLSPVESYGKGFVVVVVHDGIPHADDVLAVAIVKRWAHLTNNDVFIRRTRNSEKFVGASFVLDVGAKRGIESWDEKANPTLFLDHHQDDVFYEDKDVNKKHYPEGVKMAACGMIWEVLFGKSCSYNFNQFVRETLLYPVESRDNGQIPDPSAPANLLSFVQAVTSPQSSSTTMTPSAMDIMFDKAVEMAESVLDGVINMARSVDEEPRIWEKALADLENQNPPVVIELSKGIRSWKKFYFRDREKVGTLKTALYILFPDWDGQAWCLQALPKEEGKNDVVRPLPEEWPNEGKKLLNNGFIFCHKGLWLAKFKTQNDAINAIYRYIYIDE